MQLWASLCTVSIFLLLTISAGADTEDAIFLYKFKNAIRQDPSQVFTSWRLNSPVRPCDWMGVDCDVSVLKTGVPVVRGVSLPYKDILGTLWKELGRLKFLKTLNLTGNRFERQLPSYIEGALVLETLDLSHNAFTGTLPSLQKLTYLKTLLISNNQLEGDFPSTACDGDALRTVDMSNNRMRGTLTKDVSRCSKLEVLRLSGNALHGDIPTALGELTRLRVLDLSANQLTGGLPEAIGQMPYLTHLLLNDNHFTGFITPSLSSATYMVSLDLSNNQIGKNIPESLGSLAYLERLSLSNNKLQGSIPQSFGKLTSLVSSLDLSHNMLVGGVPSSVVNLERLQNLDVSNNGLSGNLPDNWEGLYSLKTIDLSSNKFDGSIPASLTSLKNVEYLNLSHNELGGDIPLEICSLITLSVLDLSYNGLVGIIPDAFGQLSSLTFFNGSHNGLIGSLPLSLENLTYLDVFDVSHNELSGLLPDLPLFRRLAESGYLDDEKGLCGPIFNVTCSLEANIFANVGGKVYKFLKSKEEQLKYLPLLIVSMLGVGTLLLLLLCLALQVLRPKLYQEIMEFCDVTFSGLLCYCGKKSRFSYKDLRLATEHFCNRNIIGVGARCKVFLGQLPNKETIAIKVLNHELFWETQPHFLQDCRALSKVRHANVMEMRDWCYKPGFLASVYAYMPRGSLNDNLYKKKPSGSLTWQERLGISLDVARGLAYLHECRKKKKWSLYCRLCPSNILLDERCGAKVAGLWVVRESPAVATLEGVLNKKVESRPDAKDFANYLAPECTDERQINEQAEVYTYGLTILELITRKRSVGGFLSMDKTLPARMRQLFPQRVKQLVDNGILRTTGDANQVLTLIGIALSCTEDNPLERPDMASVVSALTRLKKGEVDANLLQQPDIYQGDVSILDSYASSQPNSNQPLSTGLFIEGNVPYQTVFPGLASSLQHPFMNISYV